MQALADIGEKVHESYARTYVRATDSYAAIVPGSGSINCVSVPEAMLDTMQARIRDLLQGAQHHQHETELLRLTLQREFYTQTDERQAHHRSVVGDMQAAMEELSCAADLLQVCV